MYLDDFTSDVLELLKEQFHPKNYDRLYPMVATTLNVFKKIVNLKSVLYKQEADRIWYKRNGEDLDENFSNIINGTNIHSTMQVVNKLTNVNNTSFCRIIGNKDEVRYEAVPSETVSVIQDENDPTKIKALLHAVTVTDSYKKLGTIAKANGLINLSGDSDKYISKYFYWDAENYMVLDAEMAKVGEPQPNPYRDKNGNGIIPYVLFSSFPSVAGSIWNETINSDLYTGTLQTNVFQTYLNNLLKQAGYRQLVLTGVSDDQIAKLNEQVSDSLQPVVLSDKDAKIVALALSGDINEVKSCIHDHISEIADNHGVSYDSRTSSAQKMGAKALQISQEQIDNIREEQTPLYRESEKELMNKIVIVANADLNANIDIEGSPAINFAESEEYISDSDKLEIQKWNLEHNIISLVDVYKDNDPDCDSTEDAIKRIEINKEINDKYTDSLGFIPEEADDGN